MVIATSGLVELSDVHIVATSVELFATAVVAELELESWADVVVGVTDVESVLSVSDTGI